MRLLGLGDAPAATIVMVAFVLLGDFRVYLLVFTLMTYAGARHEIRVADRSSPPATPCGGCRPGGRRRRRGDAGRAGGRGRRRRRAPRPQARSPSQSIWLVYELAFLAVALVLRAWVVPATRAGRRAAPAELPARRPRLRRGLLRPLGDGRRHHPRRLRRRLGASHASEPALLRVLGAVRVRFVLRAPVGIDEHVDPGLEIGVGAGGAGGARIADGAARRVVAEARVEERLRIGDERVYPGASAAARTASGRSARRIEVSSSPA